MTPEELQKVFEELSGEIGRIKSEYQKADGILKKIQEFSVTLDQLKPLIESSKSEVVTSSEQIKTLKSDIEASQKQSQDLVNDISTNLEKVKGNIVSMQEAYEQFSELKGKISGRGEEIEGLVNSSRGLQKDIENIKSQAQQTLDSIKAVLADVQTKTQEMQAAYEGFLQIKGQIDNKETGLQAIFDLVGTIKTKAESLNKEIQSFRDESKRLLDDIKKHKESSEALEKEIVGNLEKSQKSVEEVEKITDLITDTGFANAFQSRAKKLFWGYIVWGAIFGVGVIVLTFLLIHFFKDQNGSIPAPSYVIYRLALTSPLLFLIGFAMTQYKKERDLNEKYEFKAVSATVLRGHIKFLIEKFGIENGVNDFSCETFAKIYKEPYNNGIEVKRESVVNIGKNKEIKQRLSNLRGIVESVKDLKSLAPDEETLKIVLEILYKK